MWEDLTALGLRLIKTEPRRKSKPPSLVALYHGEVVQYDAKPKQLLVADSDTLIMTYLPQRLTRQRSDLLRAQKNSSALAPSALCRLCILEALVSVKAGEAITAGSVWQHILELSGVKRRAETQAYRSLFTQAWHNISWQLPNQ